MKKWMYLIFPGVMLAGFLVIYFSHKAKAEEKERAHIAQDIAGPDPDFAGLAKSMGWYAKGPIENPADIAAALRRAVAKVKAGTPALVDTVVRPR